MSWGSQTILPMHRNGMNITSVISGTISSFLDYIITFWVTYSHCIETTWFFIGSLTLSICLSH